MMTKAIKSVKMMAVHNDLANRAARGNRSQYRLSFANATDNNSTGDRAVFTASESGTNRPVLSISYLIP
jgi:flagellar basal body rod protein FlgF